MAEIKLIKVTHQQSRLEFFEKQLDKATRSMNYHVKRKHHPDICAEYGEIASFYEWAVDKAKEPGWIPVSERLPDEHESIFKKFYGTNKWTSAMFQTISDNVLAVVSHKDGSKTVKTMCTLDGEWRIADGRPWNITHWMPLPEPPKEVDK